MLHAKIENGKKSATLVKLLNLDPCIQLVNVDSVLSPLNLLSDTALLDIGVELDSTFKNRPEYAALELDLKSMEVEKKL